MSFSVQNCSFIAGACAEFVSVLQPCNTEASRVVSIHSLDVDFSLREDQSFELIAQYTFRLGP